MPLDPQARFVLDQMAAQGGLEVENQTPAQARAAFEQMRLPLPLEEVARVEDRTIPGPAGAIPVRVYRSAPIPRSEPKANGDAHELRPALVCFHGGGWVIGEPRLARRLCAARSPTARDAVSSSVDYRLAPEARYPAAAEDCYAATRGSRSTAPRSASTAGASPSAATARAATSPRRCR